MAKCQIKKIQFTDPSFPPTPRALYYKSETYHEMIADNKNARIYWLRHRETRNIEYLNPREHPEVFRWPWAVIRQPQASDITQGVLGNCWLLSAMAVIVERPELLSKILATTELSEKGVYRVRLYKDGKLLSIIIDDLFPCNSKRFLIYSCVSFEKLLLFLSSTFVFFL